MCTVFVQFTCTCTCASMCMCLLVQAVDSEEPISVLLPLPKSDSGSIVQEKSDTVLWQPPHIDWSPWTNRSAYMNSGPLAHLEPEARAAQSSQLLCSELARRKATDPSLQKVWTASYAVHFVQSNTLKDVHFGRIMIPHWFDVVCVCASRMTIVVQCGLQLFGRDGMLTLIGYIIMMSSSAVHFGLSQD